MADTIRYHVEFTDDADGFQAVSLAAAVDGTVHSTVRAFNGREDLALIDVDLDLRESMEAMLEEELEAGRVTNWRTSVALTDED